MCFSRSSAVTSEGPACLSWLPGGCRGVCPGHTHRSVSQWHGSGVRSGRNWSPARTALVLGQREVIPLTLSIVWRCVGGVTPSLWGRCPPVLGQSCCRCNSCGAESGVIGLAHHTLLVPQCDCWWENAFHQPLTGAEVRGFTHSEILLLRSRWKRVVIWVPAAFLCSPNRPQLTACLLLLAPSSANPWEVVKIRVDQQPPLPPDPHSDARSVPRWSSSRHLHAWAH